MRAIHHVERANAKHTRLQKHKTTNQSNEKEDNSTERTTILRPRGDISFLCLYYTPQRRGRKEEEREQANFLSNHMALKFSSWQAFWWAWVQCNCQMRQERGLFGAPIPKRRVNLPKTTCTPKIVPPTNQTPASRVPAGVNVLFGLWCGTFFCFSSCVLCACLVVRASLSPPPCPFPHVCVCMGAASSLPASLRRGGGGGRQCV